MPGSMIIFVILPLLVLYNLTIAYLWFKKRRQSVVDDGAANELL